MLTKLLWPQNQNLRRRRWWLQHRPVHKNRNLAETRWAGAIGGWRSDWPLGVKTDREESAFDRESQQKHELSIPVTRIGTEVSQDVLYSMEMLGRSRLKFTPHTSQLPCSLPSTQGNQSCCFKPLQPMVGCILEVAQLALLTAAVACWSLGKSWWVRKSFLRSTGLGDFDVFAPCHSFIYHSVRSDR